jgi:hypothetical protein
MTRNQIKAELRRSALEDKYPFCEITRKVDNLLAQCVDRPNEMLYQLTSDEQRIFFLLVAEAL